MLMCALSEPICTRKMLLKNPAAVSYWVLTRSLDSSTCSRSRVHTRRRRAVPSAARHRAAVTNELAVATSGIRKKPESCGRAQVQL